MLRLSLNSSMIASAGYDKKKSILEIEFNSGAVWHYYDVREKTFNGLKKAKSAGRYLVIVLKMNFRKTR
jgi:hypothetical protein